MTTELLKLWKGAIQNITNRAEKKANRIIFRIVRVFCKLFRHQTDGMKARSEIQRLNSLFQLSMPNDFQVNDSVSKYFYNSASSKTLTQTI